MKTAMIWGAGGGIGAALRDQLQDDGWQVAAIYRQPQRSTHPKQIAVDADVADLYSMELAMTTLSQQIEQVDLWVYAVGDIISQKTAEMAPDVWQQIIEANLSGAYAATHFSMPLIAADAHLVYLGAISERLRLPGLSAYVAAKAGLEAFTDALRKEERKRKITLLRPGAVATKFWDKVPLRLPKNALQPEDVATRIRQIYDAGETGAIDLTT